MKLDIVTNVKAQKSVHGVLLITPSLTMTQKHVWKLVN